MRRPTSDEYHSFFETYISKVTGVDFMSYINDQAVSTTALLRTLSAEQWDYRYAEDKWSIREVIIHMVDTEQIFAYRALRIARHDKTPLPGFEQNDYVPYYEAASRSSESIIEAYEAVRKVTLTQFKNFSDEMLDQVGTVSGHAASARAFGFMIAGHELHHLDVLKDKYGISS